MAERNIAKGTQISVPSLHPSEFITIIGIRYVQSTLQMKEVHILRRSIGGRKSANIQLLSMADMVIHA